MTEQAIAAQGLSKPVENRKKRTVEGQSADERRYFWQVNGMIIYYLALIIGLFWLLVDVWSGNFKAMQALGVGGSQLQQPLLKTINYTVVGAMFGNVLFQIRSLFTFYLDNDGNDYDERWLGKYLIGPFESAALSLVVLALIRGGVALFGGQSGPITTSTNNFAVFGVGSLIGFGMRDALIWLRTMAGTMFNSNGQASGKENTQGLQGR